MVRQVADEPDGIREHHRVASAEVPALHPRRERREELLVREGPAADFAEVELNESGVYRVEVDRLINLFPIDGTRLQPWIFSNPIYVNL